jgi:hypothetical protein
MAITVPGLVAIGLLEVTIWISRIDMSGGSITAAGQLIPLVVGLYVLVSAVMMDVNYLYLLRRGKEWRDMTRVRDWRKM